MPSSPSVFADPILDAQFREKGYVVAQMLGPDEIASLGALWRELNPQLGTDFFPSLFHPDPEYRRRIDEAVSAALQPKADLLLPGYRATMSSYIVKRANSTSGKIHMHQDYTMVDPSKYTAVHFWCPLVDVEKSSACLQVVEGSHKMTEHIGGVPMFNSPKGSIHTPNPSPWDAVIPKLYEECSTPVPLKAGWGVFWHPRLLHWSQENQSSVDRVTAGSLFMPPGANQRFYFWDWNLPGKFEIVDVLGPLGMSLGDVPKLSAPYPAHFRSVGFMDYSCTPFSAEDIDCLVVNKAS